MQQQMKQSLASTSSHQHRLPVLAPRRAAPLRSRIAPVAALQTQEKPAWAKWSDSVGMPTDDGIFGFTPFAEMWVGRWAQLGFVSSIVAEFITGHGTLQQLGLPSPSTPMLVALCLLFGGASVAGTVRTVQRATAKQMSKSEIARYKAFLGLNKEDDDRAKEEALRMKRAGDFTTPGLDSAAINAARAAGSPVDGFLSTNELAESTMAVQEMKSSAVATATINRETLEAEAQELAERRAAAAERAARAKQYAESMYFGEKGELEYARGIEMTNGRWAMVGFLAAILVEAATGEGIIAQLISIFKWSGLLGDKSGF